MLALVVSMAISLSAQSQVYPDKIRGYKVHRAKVSVRTPDSTSPKAESSAEIVLGKPKLDDVGLTGVTFEVGAEVTSSDHSGKVEFLTFSDIKVNGIAVSVEEYANKFEFKKGERIVLPMPASVTISTLNMARAARNELLDPKKKWRLTGTVFVFGKFKKFGFSFKRVVPIEIDAMVDNPIRK
ncbi:MAG TPA: hypothetical protein PKA82_11130 [Pyrinomonadaceae bacterium]|nr:hypothetical protein [Pyrinomonadaceae bacterium]